MEKTPEGLSLTKSYLPYFEVPRIVASRRAHNKFTYEIYGWSESHTWSMFRDPASHRPDAEYQIPLSAAIKRASSVPLRAPLWDTGPAASPTDTDDNTLSAGERNVIGNDCCNSWLALETHTKTYRNTNQPMSGETGGVPTQLLKNRARPRDDGAAALRSLATTTTTCSTFPLIVVDNTLVVKCSDGAVLNRMFHFRRPSLQDVRGFGRLFNGLLL